MSLTQSDSILHVLMMWFSSAIYIGGIMMYKFGLEFFNGSITTLATDRFKAVNTFTKRTKIYSLFYESV